MNTSRWQRTCCILFFCITVLYAAPAAAAQLHAILVADTNDCSIGNSVACDLEEMQVLMAQIASGADMELAEKIFQGRSCHPKLVKDYLERLEVDDDDVVVYYQSSHGFRTANMHEQWPALYFGAGKHALRLQDISDVIKRKKPAFSLVLADVCNSVSSYTPPFETINSRQILDGSQRADGFWYLFREATGNVTACSSKPGQYSYCIPYGGGVFTTAMLEAMDTVVEEPQPTWNRVMTVASRQSMELAKSMGIKQKPCFCLEGECGGQDCPEDEAESSPELAQEEVDIQEFVWDLLELVSEQFANEW